MRKKIPTNDSFTLERIQHYRIRPKHSFGQHFLIDEPVYQRIISASSLSADTSVIEIGAGFGSLTRYLAQNAKQVLAIELDRDVYPLLRRECAKNERITTLCIDALSMDPENLCQHFPKPPSSYCVVSNLPYNITSKTLEHFLAASFPPTHLVLMIQKEVADRISAQPGNLSMLGLVTQWHAKVQKLFEVPAESFSPPPDVASAVVRLDVRKKPPITLPKGITPENVFRIAKMGFTKKRKMLQNSLAATFRVPKTDITKVFSEISIPFAARPQELGIEQWVDLTKACKSKGW